MADRFLVRIKLTNFINSRIIDQDNGDGHIEKGLFIPLEINGLSKTSMNQVFAFGFVNPKMHDTGDGYEYYIKQMLSKDIMRKQFELGYTPPYLGNMRKTNYKQNYKDIMFKFSEKRVKQEDYE